MGDVRARDMVAICIEVMRNATEQRQGTVIKTMGDEVMATFPTADAALSAAAQMQQQISTHAQLKIEGQPVAIRIGCHFGPVMLENRDVFGAAVHTANRMTSQAKAGQSVTTAAMVERLSPEWRAACRAQIDIATLKGQGSEVALYEVLWQTEDVTSKVPRIATEARPARAMRLRQRCEDRDLQLDERHSSITIGRAEDNDIVIKGNLISRLHARIEISRNKFVLIDQSTNGTFVQRLGRLEESFVRRDSLQIRGQGNDRPRALPERARRRLSASPAKGAEATPRNPGSPCPAGIQRESRRSVSWARLSRAAVPCCRAPRASFAEEDDRRRCRGIRADRRLPCATGRRIDREQRRECLRPEIESVQVEVLGARQAATMAESLAPARPGTSAPASRRGPAGSRQTQARGTCRRRRAGTS